MSQISKYEKDRREFLNKKYGMQGLDAVIEFRPSKMEINAPQPPNGPSPEQKFLDEKKQKFNLPNGLELEGLAKPKEEISVQNLQENRDRQEVLGTKLVAADAGRKQKFWFSVKI